MFVIKSSDAHTADMNIIIDDMPMSDWPGAVDLYFLTPSSWTDNSFAAKAFATQSEAENYIEAELEIQPEFSGATFAVEEV